MQNVSSGTDTNTSQQIRSTSLNTGSISQIQSQSQSQFSPTSLSQPKFPQPNYHSQIQQHALSRLQIPYASQSQSPVSHDSNSNSNSQSQSEPQSRPLPQTYAPEPQVSSTSSVSSKEHVESSIRKLDRDNGQEAKFSNPGDRGLNLQSVNSMKTSQQVRSSSLSQSPLSYSHSQPWNQLSAYTQPQAHSSDPSRSDTAELTKGDHSKPLAVKSEYGQEEKFSVSARPPFEEGLNLRQTQANRTFSKSRQQVCYHVQTFEFHFSSSFLIYDLSLKYSCHRIHNLRPRLRRQLKLYYQVLQFRAQRTSLRTIGE
jgi:hypothetical protein